MCLDYDSVIDFVSTMYISIPTGRAVCNLLRYVIYSLLPPFNKKHMPRM